MLNEFLLVVNQVLILFLLISAGFIITKFGLVSKQVAKQMTDILLILVTPAVIINAFEIPFDKSRLFGLCIAAVSAIFTHIIGILIGKLFFKKEPDYKQSVYRFAIIYSNSGFMALPLIQAIVGQEGILYGAIYLIVFNIFLWTHGVTMMSNSNDNMLLRHAFINPGIIGTSIALVLFLFSLSLPSPVHSAVKMLADINTPLAMIIIGSFMANVKFNSIFSNKEIFLSAAFRLIVIPLIVLFTLFWFQLPKTLYMTCIISASAPSAANTTLFSARFSKDTELASELIAFTTACSIVTIPLLLMLIT